jgi:hypothetical protein
MTELLATDVLVAAMAATTWGPPGEILGGFSFVPATGNQAKSYAPGARA